MKKSKLVFFLFIFMQNVFALSEQYLPGTAPEIKFKTKVNKSSSIPNYQDSTLDKSLSENNESVFMPNSVNTKILNGKESTYRSFSQNLMNDSLSSDDSTLKLDQKELFNKYYNKGDSSFTFTYFTDNYSISDSGNIFNRTFKGTARSGYLIFSLEKTIFRKYVSMFYGFDFGFSFSHANGIFQGGDISNTDIKFWIIPLDFLLKLEVPIMKVSKVSIYGGPSIVGVWQTRSDMDQGESVGDAYQSRRQVGYGYFAGARLSLSLGNFMNSTFKNLYTSMSASNFFMNIDGRYQHYSNFLDPLTIQGTSLGIGFSFEFL